MLVPFQQTVYPTMTQSLSLRETLRRHTRKAELFAPLENHWVMCYACGHRCKIPPGREGICKVRYNDSGMLYAPANYVAGLQVDPIEKKPFFHALPGSHALSFGMLGCDYHCAYCQNWYSSQTLRDEMAGAAPEPISAEQIVSIALEHRTPIITSTYNEPLITTEWAVEVFRLAQKHRIKCSYVSNGNATPEVLDYLQPYIQLYKIDLKSFRQKNYQQLGGRLDTVLDTIRLLHARKIWVEVVTLLVPDFNDDPGEVRDIARFLASVSIDIPWHVTAFHQNYRMMDPSPTSPSALVRAAEIGRQEGLRYVYAGNLPGMTQNLENTYCPSCRTLVIERIGFSIKQNLLHNGSCPKCSTPVAGVWA
jgi:pyruvate formate lyase activating enzyme